MVQTISANYEEFTKEDIHKAKEARDAQAMVAYHLDAKLKHVLSSTNAVLNCSVTLPDITNAQAIFGLDRARIRGKTVFWRPEAGRPEYVSIP